MPNSVRQHHQFAPPTLEVGRRAPQPGRQGPPSRRARATRRAGPAHRRPSGRRPSRRSRCRSTARCRRRSSRRRWQSDFGLDVTFRETTTICVERPVGTGAAVEILQDESNPFLATIGLRSILRRSTRASASGSASNIGVVPMYIYKTADELREPDGAVRRRHAPGGPVRLAGHRLRRDDDRLRLQRSGPRQPPTSESSRRWF